MSHAEFDTFRRLDVVYKTLDGVPFEAVVVAPNSALAS